MGQPNPIDLLRRPTIALCDISVLVDNKNVQRGMVDFDDLERHGRLRSALDVAKPLLRLFEAVTQQRAIIGRRPACDAAQECGIGWRCHLRDETQILPGDLLHDTLVHGLRVGMLQRKIKLSQPASDDLDDVAC